MAEASVLGADKSTWERVRALAARDRRTAARLMRMYHDLAGHPAQQQTLIGLLGGLPYVEVLALVEGLIADSGARPELRAIAIASVMNRAFVKQRWMSAAQGRHLQATLSQIVRDGMDSLEVRRAALGALQSVGHHDVDELRDVVSTALVSGDQELIEKGYVVASQRLRGDPQLMAEARNTLHQEPDELLAGAALSYLSTSGGAEVRELMLAELSMNRSATIRGLIAEQLGSHSHRAQVRGRLIAALGDTDQAVQLAAISSLRRGFYFNDAAALRALRAAVADPAAGQSVRVAAAAAYIFRSKVDELVTPQAAREFLRSVAQRESSAQLREQLEAIAAGGQ